MWSTELDEFARFVDAARRDRGLRLVSAWMDLQAPPTLAALRGAPNAQIPLPGPGAAPARP